MTVGTYDRKLGVKPNSQKSHCTQSCRGYFTDLFSERQIHLRHLTLVGDGDLKQLSGLEPEATRNQVGREFLLRDVVASGDVIVELPREADLVLGRGQLLLQRLNVLARAQLR